MTIQELKEVCLNAKDKGLERVMLVVPRKGPPTSEFVRVRGLGKGYICNAGEREDGTWSVVAQFEVEKIMKGIEYQEKMDALAERTK